MVTNAVLALRGEDERRPRRDSAATRDTARSTIGARLPKIEYGPSAVSPAIEVAAARDVAIELSRRPG